MQMMNRIRNIRYVLVLFAILIAIGTLVTSNYLISDLEQEERNRMEVWAEAMRSLNMADENTDMNLVLKVINGNHTIPVVIVDKEGMALSARNVGMSFSADEDSLQYLSAVAKEFQASGRSIRIDLPQEFDPDGYITICYDESLMLKRLAIYPYIQLGVVVLFVLIAIFALFSAMRAEQNKVWVGLSKETAHQLGTPISSLIAWHEVLRDTYPDDTLLPEMEKDIKRLERIADRFSKIGSIPEPKPEDVLEVIERVVTYMRKRTSNKVTISTHFPDEPVIASVIASLFEWVVENLCKNAVDAMGGAGAIDIEVDEDEKRVYVDVKDTGKGIAKSNFNSVFKPGFTTKERGWGLGLSLAKRIVEEYHRGKIFVADSEIGMGTTFRIVLPKAPSEA
ncbi:MAG: HAMP domain-containing sensor histidine kinase [Bacteroidales bacterium]|nr:HAMP domain-containing sensor histidine kinase [Bacteroidales bacterium]